jgi:hypothetical protein
LGAINGAKDITVIHVQVALICIAGFGAVVIALLGFVYSSTASYVLNQSDRAIDAYHAVLIAAYEHGGRDELVATIGKLAAGQRLENSIYLLADASFGTVAGNLKTWPAALSGSADRSDFDAKEANPEATDQSLLRARSETLPDGSHLLVGRNVSDFAQFARKIYLALAFVVVLIFVLAAVAGTPPAGPSCKAALASGCRSAVRGTNGINWRKISIPCSTASRC